jgi:hypothetical protein
MDVMGANSLTGEQRLKGTSQSPADRDAPAAAAARSSHSGLIPNPRSDGEGATALADGGAMPPRRSGSSYFVVTVGLPDDLMPTRRRPV